MKTTLSLFLLALGGGLLGQPRVETSQMYERLLCIVPMTGGGSYADPRRPLYAPAPGAPPSRSGILAYTYHLSEDGQFALVEFVGARRSAFAPILADRTVKAFSKGKARQADIEAEFRKYKKNFDLSKLRVMVP